MIYLDNAATTYPKPDCVYEALDFANRNLAFNAGRGNYRESEKAFTLITDARTAVASLVNKRGESVIFSSSATEALNQIIYGLPLAEGDTVYISPFEHNAIVRPLFHLKKRVGINIEILPFDKDCWEVDLRLLNNRFALSHPKAILISQVSNVTGYCIPYEEIFSLGHKYNSINVLDSSQSYGIIPIIDADTDYIVFAGHKSLYASFGVAGFIQMNKDKLGAVKAGGTGSDSLNVLMSESGSAKFEAGSMNTVAIAGLLRSIEWLKKTPILEKEKELTEYAIDRLSSIDGIVLFLPPEKEVIGVISFAIPGYRAEDIGTILYDEFSICCRTGYHCAPFVHELIGSIEYGGTVRASFGYFTTKKDIDSLAYGIQSIVRD